MSNQILRLEDEKDELNTMNKKTIDENRYLLDQLEELNNQVAASDAQIAALNTTLESTRREMDKLNSLAAQASLLEAQLSIMEADQARLHHELTVKGQETQIIAQRWKLADRTSTSLSKQVDRIENEAREERQRHVEVVTRLERRLSVQRELEGSNQEVSRTASAPTQANGRSHNAVSNFVKEILQDNANLQMGICELHELLSDSNEEVEKLRERGVDPSPDTRKPSNISDRMEPSRELAVDSPLHVHHHYHAPPSSRRDKSVGLGRLNRRKKPSSAGLRSPRTDMQFPHSSPSPLQLGPMAATSLSTILSQTTVSVPPHERPHNGRRESLRSLRTSFSNEQLSGPGSPISSCYEQSVFDLTDEIADSTRPTTPASTELGSPEYPNYHRKRNSDVSIRNLITNPSLSRPSKASTRQVHRDSLDELARANKTVLSPDPRTIPEEPDEDGGVELSYPEGSSTIIDSDTVSMLRFQPRLQRASSAESIFSLRDVDRPQLHTRASQFLNNGRASLSPSMASVEQASSISATGRTSKATKHQDPSSYTKLLLANSSRTSSLGPPPATKAPATLGKKLGGWVAGKWGVAPTASGFGSAGDKANTDRAGQSRSKPVGVSVVHVPTRVEAALVDSALLKDALG